MITHRTVRLDGYIGAGIATNLLASRTRQEFVGRRSKNAVDTFHRREHLFKRLIDV